MTKHTFKQIIIAILNESNVYKIVCIIVFVVIKMTIKNLSKEEMNYLLSEKKLSDNQTYIIYIFYTGRSFLNMSLLSSNVY